MPAVLSVRDVANLYVVFFVFFLVFVQRARNSENHERARGATMLSSGSSRSNKKKKNGRGGGKKVEPAEEASRTASRTASSRPSEHEEDPDPGRGLHAVMNVQGDDDSGLTVHAMLCLKCVGQDGVMGKYTCFGTVYSVDKACFRDESTQKMVAMLAISYMKATDILEDGNHDVLRAQAVKEGWAQEKRGGVTWYKKDPDVLPDRLCVIENLSKLMELPDFMDTLVQIERVETLEELERTSKTALRAAGVDVAKMGNLVPEREMPLQDITAPGYGKHCILKIYNCLVTAYICLKCVRDEGKSGVYHCVKGLCTFAEEPECNDRASLAKHISQAVADLAVKYAQADDCGWKSVTRKSLVHQLHKATTIKNAEVELKRIKSIREFEAAVRTLEVNCRQNADRNMWMSLQAFLTA